MVKASNNVTSIFKRYYVEIIFQEGVGHGNKTYWKANITCDELIDENTEYTKQWVLKSQKKNDTFYIPGFLKYIWIQQLCFLSLYLKCGLLSKYLNLFPMFLSSYTSKRKSFEKNAKLSQVLALIKRLPYNSIPK